MKKLLLASLITLASTPALAIEGGKPLDWAKHDNLVRMNCTGTIIGGKFVLTADHCFDKGQKLGAVTLSDNNTAQIKEYYRPSQENNADVAIWELVVTPSITAFNPLSMQTVVVGDKLKINGFGAAQTTPKQAIKSVFSITNIIYDTIDIGSGITEGGDSGSPVIKENAIVAVHSAGIGARSNEERVNFLKTRNAILDTVDGWHYPTVVKTTNGKADIPIQSLFAENQGTGAISLFNEIITEGDINASIDPECQSYEHKEGVHIATPSDINPFDLCTIHITAADDAYGVLTIRNPAGNGRDAIITINPQAKPKPQPNPKPEPSKGGSGGSTSILTLIGLLGIALKRKLF